MLFAIKYYAPLLEKSLYRGDLPLGGGCLMETLISLAIAVALGIFTFLKLLKRKESGGCPA